MDMSQIEPLRQYQGLLMLREGQQGFCRGNLHEEPEYATGQRAASVLMHARILLKAEATPDGPGWDDRRIAEALD